MIGRRRQKERTQLFQITAYFSWSWAGRAEAGPFGRGSLLTWHCPQRPCWGSSRPVTTTPLTPLSLPTEERREAAFSLSRHSGEKPRAHFPDGGHQVLERARPKWRELPCSHGASGGKGSRDCPGEQARPGHAGERRK